MEGIVTEPLIREEVVDAVKAIERTHERLLNDKKGLDERLAAIPKEELHDVMHVVMIALLTRIKDKT